MWCHEVEATLTGRLHEQTFDFNKQAGDNFLVITIWDGTDDGKKDTAIDEKLGEKRVDLRLQVSLSDMVISKFDSLDNYSAGHGSGQGAIHHHREEY